MAFEKVSAGYGKALEKPAEEHNMAYTTDGKLWLASLKGVEQKTFSFYHRTMLLGGYLTNFDLSTKTWSKVTEFSEIDSDENREDILFGWKNHLLMLVYSRYDGLTYRQILYWKDGKWNQIEFKVDEASQFASGHRAHLVLADGDSSSGDFYLVASSDSIKVSHLSLSEQDGALKAQISHICDVPSFEVPFMMQQGFVIRAVVEGDLLYVLGVFGGCGYHWAPDQIVKVKIGEKKCEVLGERGEMKFHKLASGYGKAIEKPEEYHNIAYTSDGKLWLASLTGVEQPKFSYYHRTILHGGYILNFDLSTKKWSKPIKFGAIDKDENREDILFGWKNHLLMLVYSRYNGLTYRQILDWKDGKWNQIEFKADKSSQLSQKDTRGMDLILADGHTESGEFTLLATGPESIIISRLNLTESNEVVSSGHVTHVTNVSSSEVSFLRCDGMVIRAVVDKHKHEHKHKLYCIGAENMCAYHWQPNQILCVDLEEKKAKMIAEDEESQSPLTPPWSFTGPHSSVGLSGGKWLMVGGSIATGECDSEFSRELWALSLNAKPTWSKLDIELPSDTKEDGLLIAGDHRDSVFVCDKSSVYSAMF